MRRERVGLSVSIAYEFGARDRGGGASSLSLQSGLQCEGGFVSDRSDNQGISRDNDRSASIAGDCATQSSVGDVVSLATLRITIFGNTPPNTLNAVTVRTGL